MAKVFFSDGSAFEIKGGKRKAVKAVEVPLAEDCCKLNCCDGTIDFIDRDDVLQQIPLQDLWDLLNPA